MTLSIVIADDHRYVKVDVDSFTETGAGGLNPAHL